MKGMDNDRPLLRPLHLLPLDVEHLLFIPFNPAGPGLFAGSRRLPCLGASCHLFPELAVITGFVGYPHLFLLMTMIPDLDKLPVTFLGIAGQLGEADLSPRLYRVSKVWPSAGFLSWEGPSPVTLPLAQYPGPDENPPVVQAVSVDSIHRETSGWLQTQLDKGPRCVEMELFPLAHRLSHPPTAYLVTSDLVTPRGVIPFPSAALRRTFEEAYSRVLARIGSSRS